MSKPPRKLGGTATRPAVDIYDFLCFQELFMRGVDTACDCETGSWRGVCDVFGLICFQERFAEACG